ncbi:hypothetical protein BGX27_002843 [Mortierella sp. AM989]|nr:hypothetical protein BGX27_002843 [Mortierella sp. AM989]
MTFRCQGDYWRCDAARNWTGNPVFDPEFCDYMTSLKNRDGRAGVSKQSLAMSHQDLSILMQHLQKPEVIHRNEELLRLSGKDINLNQITNTGSPFLKITLVFRKTNQADVSKVNDWLQWLEKNARTLRHDDFLFPGLATDGRVKLKDAFSHTRIQSLLDQFTSDAGLLENKNGRYTTHCFRRGGAQHRFMFAKEKWSLKAVKWWGGWSEGEAVGTIMRYLLDEFVRYEQGYGDMLSPSRVDSRHSVFMGEALSMEPVTKQAFAISQETH